VCASASRSDSGSTSPSARWRRSTRRPTAGRPGASALHGHRRHPGGTQLWSTWNSPRGLRSEPRRPHTPRGIERQAAAGHRPKPPASPLRGARPEQAYAQRVQHRLSTGRVHSSAALVSGAPCPRCTSPHPPPASHSPYTCETSVCGRGRSGWQRTRLANFLHRHGAPHPSVLRGTVFPLLLCPCSIMSTPVKEDV